MMRIFQFLTFPKLTPSTFVNLGRMDELCMCVFVDVRLAQFLFDDFYSSCRDYISAMFLKLCVNYFRVEISVFVFYAGRITPHLMRGFFTTAVAVFL